MVVMCNSVTVPEQSGFNKKVHQSERASLFPGLHSAQHMTLEEHQCSIS